MVNGLTAKLKNSIPVAGLGNVFAIKGRTA